MPTKKATEKARADLRRGKSPSTAAGEFVKQEIDHVRQGKHGARSTKQAIAIGLSEARRAGVPLKPPRRGTTSDKTRRSAESAYAAGQSSRKKRPSSKRSRATTAALEREPRSTVSKAALSKQAKQAARRRKARGSSQSPS
jgi:hypothetical protein